MSDKKIINLTLNVEIKTRINSANQSRVSSASQSRSVSTSDTLGNDIKGRQISSATTSRKTSANNSKEIISNTETTNNQNKQENMAHLERMKSYNKRRRQQSVVDDDIDESLYSRQLYVLGHEAMRKMQATSILVSGMSGLGVEIAKNIILGGVKSVTIHDEALVTNYDLGTQYFLKPSDIGHNRAKATVSHLRELNHYVEIKSHAGKLNSEFLKHFQIIVLTNNSLEEQEAIGKFCHEHNLQFIVAETAGVFGKIFCDFGEKFQVQDTNGENPISSMIAQIDSEGLVATLDEQRHGFEDGTIIKFADVKGMTGINGKEFKIKVLGPYTFNIGDVSQYGAYESGGVAIEVKKPVSIDFHDYHTSHKEPKYFITDFMKMGDNDTIHLCFTALQLFKAKYQHVPRAWNTEDAENFLNLVKSHNEKNYELNENLVKTFSYVARGQLTPLHSFIGGFTAQEVMKACSGKFKPIEQFLYYDCRECLPDTPNLNSDDYSAAQDNRYESQINVFGKKFQEKLGNLKYFLVGSGALGCEYLKNFAMIGLACGKNGQLVVTDMDTIEKSNLNRQFLFRSLDVGKTKSEAAGRAAKNMNPALNIRADQNRVGPETENVYGDEFFQSLDGVCNALDNVTARLYIDRRCVYYRKPLIESGTLGTKANVQLVIPHLTESYSSSQDPPEKSIPMCTLHNFPNTVDHTIQWARDRFEGLFTKSAQSAKLFVTDRQEYVRRMEKLSQLNFNDAFEEVKEVHATLIDHYPKSFEDCVIWARELWQDYFHNKLKQLLFNFPPDYLTSNGLPFWSGPKRCPFILKFDTESKLDVEFVYTAANLRAEMYGLQQVRDHKKVIEMIKNVKVQEFTPKTGVNIQVNENEPNAQNTANTSQESDLETFNKIIEQLKALDATRYKDLKPIEFEKDDDKNLHMDFIVSCSNLRAENYDIEPADKHKTKLIAGRIIPAIATTTAIIVGLDCIELFKLAMFDGEERKIERFRNAFINIALPFIGFSEPVAPQKFKYYEKEFNLWDRFEVNKEMTMGEFIEYFQKEHKILIDMVSVGETLLYSMFVSKAVREQRKSMPISKIYELVSNKPLPNYVKSLVVDLSGNDEEDNSFDDLPYVKYTFRA